MLGARRGLGFAVIVSGAVLGGGAAAHAQWVEMEPNQSCASAQRLAPGSTAFSLRGVLSGGDRDFVRFAAPAGAVLSVDLFGSAAGGENAIGDPYLGFFDSSCQLLGAADDVGTRFAAHLDLQVPADGQVILAATGCCDREFTGDHGGSGGYELLVRPAPPAIGSVFGRIVDAVSGAPLPGDSEPFAFGQLMRCDEVAGCLAVAFGFADAHGRFRIEGSESLSLGAGAYLVSGYANEYDPFTSEPVQIGPGEAFDAGELALRSPPLALSLLQGCEDLPAAGGRCSFRVRAQNRTSAPIEGLAWSLVSASGTGPQSGASQFEAGSAAGPRIVLRPALRLGPLASQELVFQFTVPGGLPDGASFCARGLASVGSRPLVDAAADSLLFCIVKGPDGRLRSSRGAAALQILADPSRARSRAASAPARAPR